MTQELQFRPVGEAALLVELGDRIDDDLNLRVLALDASLARLPPTGFLEAVPAYATLLVRFDPLATDHRAVEAHVRQLPLCTSAAGLSHQAHEISVCYDAEAAPDLEAAAKALGLGPDELVARHLAGRYRVYMCGFAPGYAYLGALDPAIQLPRKPAIVRDVPAGTVIIAGGQCIVTTMAMPTGWWRIGRSDARIFDSAAEQPCLLMPGDQVRFVRTTGQ
jgi:inhibitor of KinA